MKNSTKNSKADLEELKYVEGGICAPVGFQAAGIHCGIRKNRSKKDLAAIVSDELCQVAAVFTQNKIKGAPIAVTRENIADGTARAVICNSGNANTSAPNGARVARETCRLFSEALNIREKDVIVSSTGVIGEELLMEPFEKGIPKLVEKLSPKGSSAAAEAIMTTDTIKKELAVRFRLGGCECTIGGIAKGSGMINPNMATMLAFITTDAAISAEMLQKALDADIKDSFNQISVDGDTSTNDTVAILANGMAGNPEIRSDGPDFAVFCYMLSLVTRKLSKNIARDGEGATKMIECAVSGAPDAETARVVSKTVIQSSLLKAALFGEDANWGRILCAIGYADADFNIENTEVFLESEHGRIQVCKDATYFPFSEKKAAKILSADEILILIDMNQGEGRASAYGCDLTYDYVRINGDYRT